MQINPSPLTSSKIRLQKSLRRIFPQKNFPSMKLPKNLKKNLFPQWKLLRKNPSRKNFRPKSLRLPQKRLRRTFPSKIFLSRKIRAM